MCNALTLPDTDNETIGDELPRELKIFFASIGVVVAVFHLLTSSVIVFITATDLLVEDFF